jgi:hypothetical protein
MDGDSFTEPVFHEKLEVVQLVRKFPASYERSRHPESIKI